MDVYAGALDSVSPRIDLNIHTLDRSLVNTEEAYSDWEAYNAASFGADVPKSSETNNNSVWDKINRQIPKHHKNTSAQSADRGQSLGRPLIDLTSQDCTNMVILDDNNNSVRDNHRTSDQEPVSNTTTTNTTTTSNIITEPKKNQSDTCIICMEYSKTHAIIPCGHLLFCDKCIIASEYIGEGKKCPLCNVDTIKLLKIYM
jgi:hypothetical protein